MKDAIQIGNRLIGMHEGRIIYDVARGREEESAGRRPVKRDLKGKRRRILRNDRMMLRQNKQGYKI